MKVLLELFKNRLRNRARSPLESFGMIFIIYENVRWCFFPCMSLYIGEHRLKTQDHPIPFIRANGTNVSTLICPGRTGQQRFNHEPGQLSKCGHFWIALSQSKEERLHMYEFLCERCSFPKAHMNPKIALDQFPQLWVSN